MLVTTGRQLCRLPFPWAQIILNSAANCFHFASTYGKAAAEEEHVFHRGEF